MEEPLVQRFGRLLAAWASRRRWRERTTSHHHRWRDTELRSGAVVSASMGVSGRSASST